MYYKKNYTYHCSIFFCMWEKSFKNSRDPRKETRNIGFLEFILYKEYPENIKVTHRGSFPNIQTIDNVISVV